MQQRAVKVSEEQIRTAYQSGVTLHQASAELGLTVVTLWRKAKALGLCWKDNNTAGKGSKIPLSEILEGLHPSYQTFKLKNRLLVEGVKKNVCEVCGISAWNGKSISMQLDHKDGDPHNHRLDNLRMICPNCHSQTETYCGKNK